MLKRTLVVAGAIGALAITGLSACSSNSTGGSTAGGAANLPTVTLMVGGIDKQIYLPYELAQELGFYKKYGVNVVLSTEVQGGVGAEDAMASGQVDMAGAWYVHAIDFQVKGKAVEDVVNLSGAPGEREMCATGSGLSSPAQWSGKTLGITDLGSGTDTLTQFLAAKNGLKISDFHRLAVGAGSTAIAAIKNGSAQCVMTTQPTVLQMEKMGIATSAIDLATVQGASGSLGGVWPAAGVLAQSSWVSAHPTETQDVVDALVATMHWISTHTAQDIADNLPAAYTSNSEMSKADYVAALQQDLGQFMPDGLMPAGGPKTVLATEEQVGNATASVNLGTTFTNTFAAAADKLEGITPVTTPADSNG